MASLIYLSAAAARFLTRKKRLAAKFVGAGVPPTLVRPYISGSRDGRTTIFPRLGGEPKKRLFAN